MGEFDMIIIPDAEDAEAAEVLVDGLIGGHGYRLLLDTGAARTTVAFDGYTSTLAAIGSSNSSGVFAASSDALVVAPSIGVGPIVRKDFAMARLAADRTETRGLIGMDLLKDHCLHFFFDEKRVLVDPEDDAKVSFDLQGLHLDTRYHPYVEVVFGGLKAQAVWDTGAGITIADMDFIGRHPALFQQTGQSYGTDSAGARVETPMFIMAAAEIGNHAFRPTRVAGVNLSWVNATLETPMDLILGYSTLRQANWLFDFANKKWAVITGTAAEGGP